MLTLPVFPNLFDMIRVQYTIVIPITVAGILIYKLVKLSKQDSRYIREMCYGSDNKPLTMAHRAGMFEAPENTLTAIRTAYQNGAKGIEIDLEFTKDGVPILLHDDTIDRTTNGKGRICDAYYADIKELNAAVHMNYSLTKIVNGTVTLTTSDVYYDHIPTLMQAIELCKQFRMKINLDVKSNSTKTVKLLKSIYSCDPDIIEQMFITSFDPVIVYKIRSQCPQFLTGLIYDYPCFSYRVKSNGLRKLFSHFCDYIYYLMVHTWLPDFLGISFISLDKSLISEDYCAYWKNKGLDIMVWTVNHPKQKDYLSDVLKIPVITDTLLNVQCPNNKM